MNPTKRTLIAQLLLLSAIAPLQVRAQTLQSETNPVITPMEMMTAFLKAINSGDRATLRKFIADNVQLPPESDAIIEDITKTYFGHYTFNKGLILQRVVDQKSTSATVLVRGQATGIWGELSIFMTAQPPEYNLLAPPYKLVGLSLSDVAAPVDALPCNSLSDHDIAQLLNKLMKLHVAADAFSGTIYVAKHGRPIFARAYGLADRRWNIPNDINTRFYLASITKLFTTVAVAQLISQGRISLDDTVGKIIPEYANRDVADHVTIRNLLSHTSGLIGARAFIDKTPLSHDRKTISEQLALFINEPLSFRPGERFDYSNAGFILLGAIIEKTSGQDYFDYVREHIFIPADMKDTDFLEIDRDPPNIATGYMDAPNGSRIDNIFNLTLRGGPHAGVYSNGSDMTKFYVALSVGRLLSISSLNSIWQMTTSPDRTYGLGADVEIYNEQRIIGHGGGWTGATNRFEFYPELGYSVTILSNIDCNTQNIAYRLREWITQGRSNTCAKS